jgi:hypothetical protein
VAPHKSLQELVPIEQQLLVRTNLVWADGSGPSLQERAISNYVCSVDTDLALTPTIAPALSSPNKNDTYALKMMTATLDVPVLRILKLNWAYG